MFNSKRPTRKDITAFLPRHKSLRRSADWNHCSDVLYFHSYIVGIAPGYDDIIYSLLRFTIISGATVWPTTLLINRKKFTQAPLIDRINTWQMFSNSTAYIIILVYAVVTPMTSNACLRAIITGTLSDYTHTDNNIKTIFNTLFMTKITVAQSCIWVTSARWSIHGSTVAWLSVINCSLWYLPATWPASSHLWTRLLTSRSLEDDFQQSAVMYGRPRSICKNHPYPCRSWQLIVQ